MYKVNVQCSRCGLTRVAHRKTQEPVTNWVCRLCKAQPHIAGTIHTASSAVLPEKIQVNVSSTPPPQALPAYILFLLGWNIIMLSGCSAFLWMRKEYGVSGLLAIGCVSLFVAHFKLSREPKRRPQKNAQGDW